MVRRLLLTALVATLAVALPAAAEEDPSAETSGSPPPECLPYDLVCDDGSASIAGLPVVSTQFQADSSDGQECPLYDLNMPDNNQPIEETLTVDPDRCYRRIVYEILDDLPPWGLAMQIHSSSPMSRLPWP